MTGQYSGAKVPFHGECSISAGTDGTFTLYGSRSTSALTLANGDYVVVTDVAATSDTAATVSIYTGTNTTLDAGEAISSLPVPANGGFALPLATPHECEAVASSWNLRLKSSASATVKAQVKGYVICA